MTAYKQMTEHRSRRCRPETLLRLLLSTSYPQSTLSDLTLALNVHGGQTDLEELERNAEDLREVEKEYTLYDFVRCVEIRRTFGEIRLVVKGLDIDPAMKAINDCTETHNEMAAVTIKLVKAEEGLDDVEALATRLMELFYRSQVKSKRPGESIDNTEWRCRVKEVDRTKPNKPSRNVDTTLDVKQAIHRLATSLRKRSFHVVLTQNCILLMDQKARLFGVTKK